MIHEQQVRQLCAIHSVNNLLQISSSHDDGGHSDPFQESDDGARSTDSAADECERSASTHEWMCRGRTLNSAGSAGACGEESTAAEDSGGASAQRQRRPWRAATQREFDDIATDFTLRERRLLNASPCSSTTPGGDEGTSRGASPHRSDNTLSVLQRLRSQYGTPFFGNYALAVLEEALGRRGVQLEFYRPPTDLQRDASATHPAAASEKWILGFVVYENEERQRSALSWFSRGVSRVPLLKHLCGVGPHWFAITGVKYGRGQSRNDEERRNPDSSWFLIDSKKTTVPVFRFDAELADYLRDLQHSGCLIFRAFVENGTDDSVRGKVLS